MPGRPERNDPPAAARAATARSGPSRPLGAPVRAGRAPVLRVLEATAPRVGLATLLVLTASVTIGCQRVASRLIVPLRQAGARHDVQRGQRLAAAAKNRLAAKAFHDALAKDPDNADAHAWLGDLHAQAGDLRRASRHFRAAVKRDPENLDHAMALAGCLLRSAPTAMDRQQLLEAAVRVLRHARWLDPAHCDAALRLGVCYARLGELDLAVETLREAAAIDPTNAAPLVELGHAYRTHGGADRALAAYRAALQRNPEHLGAHNAAAKLNLTLARRGGAKGRLSQQRAQAHLRKSLLLCPGQPHVRTLLANLLAHEPQLANAEDLNAD